MIARIATIIFMPWFALIRDIRYLVLAGTFKVPTGLLFWSDPAEVPSSTSVKSECLSARRVSHPVPCGLVSLQPRASLS